MNPPSSDALLIAWNDLPSVLSLSRATLARMKAAGKFGPTVLHAGRKLLVRRGELERWVDAGMPDAREWGAIQASESRRRLKVS